MQPVGMRKVIFIEPSIGEGVFKKRKMVPTAGPALLATILRGRGYDAYCYSQLVRKLDFRDILTADLIGININTHNALNGYRIADYIRSQRPIPIVFGGFHASLNPDEAIGHCDYIIRGDADDAILELVDSLARNEEPHIAGLVHRRDSQVVTTGSRAVAAHIETVADLDLIRGYKWKARFFPYMWSTVYASRSCPYDCSFCCIIKLYGRGQKKRSVESVVTELKANLKFHRLPVVKSIPDVTWICDDNFAADRTWAKQVLREIIRQKIKTRFVIQARVEIAEDEELLALMKQAGVMRLYVGIESLNDEALAEYNKHSSLAKIQKAVSTIQAHGISVHGLFVFGDDSSRQGIGRQIADFIIRQNLSGALMQSLYLTPGTDKFVELDRQGRIITKDWSKYIGLVINFPKRIRPSRLQQEILFASKTVYSLRRLVARILSPRVRPYDKLLFAGEYLYQVAERRMMRAHIRYLTAQEAGKYDANDEFIS